MVHGERCSGNVIHFLCANLSVGAAGTEPRVFCFQLSHASLQLRDHRLQFAFRPAWSNVLGTVDVPRFDVEDKCSLGGAAIFRVVQTLHQLGIVVDDLCRAPNLDAAAVRVVHEKEKCFVVARSISICIDSIK